MFHDCDCSPDDPCYGCVMEYYREQVAQGPPPVDDPVALIRYAAMCKVVARSAESERQWAAKPTGEKVPF